MVNSIKKKELSDIGTTSETTNNANTGAYQRALSSSAINNTSNANDANNTNNNSYASYYDALKNESYKSLLDSQVQASVARDQALKYTQNTLANQGLSGQGMAQSTYAGIGNQYASALSNAQQTYQNNVNDINLQKLQEQKDNANTDSSNLQELLSTATTGNELNSTLESYGVTKNEDGTLNYDNSNLSDSAQKYLNVLYNSYNNDLTIKDTTMNSTGYKTYNEMKSNIVSPNGKSLNGRVENSIETMFNDKEMVSSNLPNGLKNGAMVQCAPNNTKNDDESVYMIYYNGSWYQSSEDQFINTDNKLTLRNGKVS